MQGRHRKNPRPPRPYAEHVKNRVKPTTNVELCQL